MKGGPKFIRLKDICKNLNISALTAHRMRKLGLLINYQKQRGYYTYDSYYKLKKFIDEYINNFGYSPTPKSCLIGLKIKEDK